jgi:beta-N-acetylhexosaminidase
VIGPRAFSADPVQTGNLAIAYFNGMRKAGVICTAKHFPGHGDAQGDSHGMLPRIRISFETLWERELLPYRMLIAEGLPAILSGHLSFPDITKADVPASLSRFFDTEVLREKMQFKGLLITDDLYMNGAHAGGMPLATVCLTALKAGNDMIMLSKTPVLNDAIWKAVYGEYLADVGFRTRIKESVRRILLTKLRYLKGENAVPLFPEREKVLALPSAEAKNFFFEQACRSITLVKGKEHIPFSPVPGEKVLLAGQHKAFFTSGKERYPQADTFYFSYNPFFNAIPSEKEEFRKLATRYDTIVFCMSNPNSLEVLNAAKGTKARVIVLSVLTPVYLRNAQWVNVAIAAYGWSVESFKAGFAVLKGDFPAEGELPVNLSNGD